MSLQNPVVANAVVGPIDRTAATPSLSFGGGAINNSGTGIRGTQTTMNLSVAGVDVGLFDSTGFTGNITATTLTVTTLTATTLTATTLTATNTVTSTLSIGAHTVILPGAGAPVDGTTGANVAGIGSLYTDITNGILYINTGTLVSPAWTKVGTQS